MKWEYSESGNYWIASRPMEEGSNCDFIYTIYPVMGGGYVAEAINNGYGAYRVAVRNKYCETQSVFDDLEILMRAIENKIVWWLYISHCNCVGEVAMEER